MGKMRVRVYTCDKHEWTLEATGPEMAGSLRVFCPLCRDEFYAKHLPEPNCKVEWRERATAK